MPNDMEALFKRGPAFDTGVDLVLKLRPLQDKQQQQQEGSGSPGPAAAPAASPEVVAAVGRLQAAAMAEGCVQVSCGYDTMNLQPQYVWMGRFLQVRLPRVVHYVELRALPPARPLCGACALLRPVPVSGWVTLDLELCSKLLCSWLLTAPGHAMGLDSLTQEEAARRFLGQPTVREALDGGDAAAFAVAGLAIVEVGAVEQSKQRM